MKEVREEKIKAVKAIELEAKEDKTKTVMLDLSKGDPMKLIIRFALPVTGNAVSAVLQYGGYYYCGKAFGTECACRCGFNRSYQFYD